MKILTPLLKEIKLNHIYQGDALEVLKTLPSESVDCVVTSPPYYGLRDYGVEGQIGQESTFQEFVSKLCDVFDETKRILKDNGTCFVNLGDSYNNHNWTPERKDRFESQEINKSNNTFGRGMGTKDLPSKCLMMIPERFAIEMINRGWILRNKLVWIKRNAMPESVQDRWKKAHEYIFFFVKSQKYYFNLDAVRTPHKQVSLDRAEYEQGRNAMESNSISKKSDVYGMPARFVRLNPDGAVPPDFLDVFTNSTDDDGTTQHYATYPQTLISPLVASGCPDGGIVLDPFFGSGTTGLVSKKQLKNYVGIELSADYIKIAEDRLSQGSLFLSPPHI